MYDYHDPRQFDETKGRPNATHDRYAAGNNAAGALIAVAILIALALGAIWLTAA